MATAAQVQLDAEDCKEIREEIREGRQIQDLVGSTASRKRRFIGTPDMSARTMVRAISTSIGRRRRRTTRIGFTCHWGSTSGFAGTASGSSLGVRRRARSTDTTSGARQKLTIRFMGNQCDGLDATRLGPAPEFRARTWRSTTRVPRNKGKTTANPSRPPT